MQKRHRIVPQFTDSNLEVVFSFCFLGPKIKLLLQPNSSSSKDSNIPFLLFLFPLLPFSSSGRKVEHGEQSGVTLLPRNSPGSPESLRGTRCGQNAGDGRSCFLEALACVSQMPESFPLHRSWFCCQMALPGPLQSSLACKTC